MTFSRKFRYLSRQTWIVETVSMILSVSCLSAIVGILATMHDRPLSDWSTPLSVTATVSVLITASKSSLLLVVASCISQRKWEYFRKPRPLLDFDTFDGASRGPLGALELLFGRARDAKTAALGAFITTIVLAWDPSAQLLIELETRSVATWKPEATFNYSTIYDSGARIGPAGSSSLSQDTGMVRAIMNGLYGVTPDPPFNCVTAKCSWEFDYTTLGFDSKCTNVTTTSKRVCNKDLEGSLRNWTTQGEIQYCNITTPGGVVIKNEYRPLDYRTALNVSSICHGEIREEYYEYGMLGCHPYMNTSTVATFAVYRSSTIDASNIDLAASWEAIECNITLAAFTHTGVSVRNSSFHIEHTKTTPLLPEFVPTSADGYSAELNTGYNEYLNFSKNGTPSKVKYLTGDEVTFKINNADWYFLVGTLHTKIFKGGITAGDYQYETDSMGIGLYAFLHENITALSANIAYTMTNHVRGTRNNTVARGWSYRDEIFVTVQWGWFVVHIVTVVACVALLVITYVTHMRSGRPAWKSGSVVLLLHWISGMDAEKWRAIEGCEAVEDYEKAVDDYVESVWVRASNSETLCLEKVDPQAGEEGIPLITQVVSTAAEVSE